MELRRITDWTLAQDRRLFEKAEFYEAWATEDRAGFHYEVAKGFSTSREGTR